MAVGPIARMVAQAVILTASVLARALPAAYAQAVQNAKKGGAQASGPAGSMLGKARISRDEALQVLNLTEGEVTVESIKKQYDKYFAANAIEKGGSFYLQSKIYRAKELLDEYEEDKKKEAEKGSESDASEKQQQSDGKQQ
mmetsp:Transcript_8502/g.12714  ORF Transcript_8502/g.12714 Transcript_8502/m.12714 type:complete len:141 (-) Transcript_8502:501-923(-)